MKKYYPNWWQAIILNLIFLILLVIVEVISLRCFDNTQPYYISIKYLFFLILWLPIYIWALRKSEVRIRDRLNVKSKSNLLWVILIALLFGLSISPLANPQEYFNAMFRGEEFKLSFTSITSDNYLFHIHEMLIIGFIGPIVEEFFHRGLVFEQWLKQYPPRLSIIMMSVVFAIMHTNESVVALFLFCLIGCYLYYYTNSLGVTIIYHITYNVTVSCLGYLYDFFSSWFYSIWYVIFMLVSCLIIFVLIRKVKGDSFVS